jgi:hypothetical protein
MLSPVGPGGWDGSVEVEGYQHRPDESTISHFNAVSPRYFETLHAPIVLGREFEERDTLPDAKGVVIVNETFARYYFKDRSPIGRWIMAHRERGRLEIVGVVEDM